ncbi:AAA family ATPase [Paraburkholderia sp. BR10937]|uniref:trifunctional serine/threonine-protein kinase/ATP-binding protein/sensor histidine kinase n=1 Tax=Paraburkholderia sp. BR10937 TaxID=3236994 RepID=UPI0034D1C559
MLAAIPLSPVQDGALNQLRYEYGIRSKLQRGFALVPEQLTIHQQNPAMLMEDPGGLMLCELVGDAMPLGKFISHAKEIALSLALAHESGLVHGALAPSNVMVHSTGLHAWLTGFRPPHADSIDTVSPNGSILMCERELLHYIAPEATGRINRVVDARSDLYSLGCIFYQMLTGSVLFPDLAPSEEVHAHLARQPMDVARFMATPLVGVAAKLRSILHRLLAKDPEERYQSATALARDLLVCQDHGIDKSTISPFVHVRFALPTPDSLVAREHEVETLLESLRDVSEGEPSPLVLLEGPAGIGKTALVQQLRRQLGNTDHEFAVGKCEQADGATPYASLARALHFLMKSALGLPPVRYEALQQKLRETLASDVPVVTANFPELTRLLGEHVYRPAVSVHAERPRFLNAITKLLGAFCERGRPLVFFLDDLQWADEGTIEVLTYAIQNPPNPFILFVGAMREQEIASTNAYAFALCAPEYSRRVRLRALSSDNVETLIRELLPGKVREIGELRDAIFEHTGGNPFFVIQFVRSLVEEGMLEYNETEREWCARVSTIAKRVVSPSLIDLLAVKVNALSVEARNALRCLALLARPASSSTLAAAMSLPQNKVFEGLKEAVDVQLLDFDEALFSFRHDRIRDAVYDGMSYAQRQSAHLRVGLNLLECAQVLELQDGIFIVVNQLNMGASLVGAAEERYRFAMVNLEAANRAKEGTAYASAVSYLSYAYTFVHEYPEYAHLVALIELRRGECEFLSKKVVAAAYRLKDVRADLLAFNDRAELARLRVALYVTLDDPEMALEVGLHFLAVETGIEIPRLPSDDDIDEEYERFKVLHAERGTDELIALQMVQNEKVRKAMYVLADLKPAALFTNRRLSDMVILRMTTLSLEYGHCDASCYAYVCLSMVVGAKYGDYSTVARFGQLAMRLPVERGLTQFQGRVQMCYGTLNLPWTGPLASARRHIEQSTLLTEQQGDVTFAVYSRRHLATNLIFSGALLSEAQEVVEVGIKIARQVGFPLVVDACIAQAWFIRSMRGAPVDIGGYDFEGDYRFLLDDCLNGKFHRDIAAFSYWTYEIQIRYLYLDYAVALHADERAERAAWASPAFLEMAEFVFYGALLRFTLSRKSSGDERNRHLTIARKRLALLAKWSSESPENFLSRERLVRAELARTIGDVTSAQSLYEEAIALAEKTSQLQIQGLAKELAARFCIDMRWQSAAQGYLRQAWSTYKLWGADAKVVQLEEEFPELNVGRRVTPGGVLGGAGDNAHQFDVWVVLKAAQALSSEMSLEALMQVLLDTALQYAGADYVVLCLLVDGGLNVVARATVTHGATEMNLESEAISPKLVPISLAYSALRTKESIVLDDARRDTHYGIDPFIREQQPRSIMCVPLVKHGMLTGLLYLENRQIAGTFTAARLQTLEVLASQAAISLENAKLYRNIENEHERRAAAERHLRDIQATLDRASRLTAMGELAAFIVHEVSQPIGAMGTCSRAATSWLRRDNPDVAEALAMLDRISIDSRRAADIVESIRTMARKSSPTIRTVDINEAIREVVGLLGDKIAGGGVIVFGNFDDGCLNVRGDRILLQQVIMNLVSNALAALSEVTGRPRQIKIDTSVDSSRVLWVTVSDTGPGISEEMARHIFDALATTKQAGMGLGLSICRSIVEAHGGRIEAVTTQDGGACFRFFIPQEDSNGAPDLGSAH